MDLWQIVFCKDSHSGISHCTYSYSVPLVTLLVEGWSSSSLCPNLGRLMGLEVMLCDFQGQIIKAE